MRPLTRDIIVSGIPWDTEVQEIIEHFEAFGQVLWVKTKEPGRTGSKRGYCIIRMVNKQAEEQVLSHIHLFGTNWVKVKHPRQQKRVRTHPPTKVREDIDRDKERRIKKFYWCKTYADFKYQEFLIKRSNSKNKITKKEFLQHHGQHAIERRRKEKRKKKREAALKAKQERLEISRYWDPTFYNDNCQEKGKDEKRKTKKKKDKKKLSKHARSEPRVKFAHKNETKTAPLNFAALLEKAATNLRK